MLLMRIASLSPWFVHFLTLAVQEGRMLKAVALYFAMCSESSIQDRICDHFFFVIAVHITVLTFERRLEL